MINVLIVDDEQFSVDAIKSYADKIPFLNVVLATTSAIEASIAVQNQDIDLVFSDVCMPELNGIELVKLIQGKSKVIFITATPDYALQGYQNDVIDYLMKPLFFETFFKAAQKAEKLIKLEKKPAQKAPKPVSDDYIMIKTERKGKIIKLKLEDILLIEGTGNYLTITTINHEKIIALLTFKVLEQSLPKEQFMRVSKSYVVPLRHVMGIDGNEVILEGVRIPIGTTYRDTVLKHFSDRIV
jgi:two-component system, LytTR family, response regulator